MATVVVEDPGERSMATVVVEDSGERSMATVVVEDSGVRRGTRFGVGAAFASSCQRRSCTANLPPLQTGDRGYF
jgi:hypothetical protein